MFVDKLRRRWAEQDTLLCVGLDPEPERFPDLFQTSSQPIFEFNRAIIDATADLVCAYKPQIAHYSACAAEPQLVATIDYIHERYPEIPVLLDAKRGDIGSTAERYAREAFDRYRADAVTVNPYLGFDAIEPFLARPEKGIVVLCRTSNPSSQTFQDLEVQGQPLYLRVAEEAIAHWNPHGNLLLTVGATFPNALRALRALTPDVPFLVLGVGVQGASVSDAVEGGLDRHGTGLLISTSRAVLYASREADFAARAREVALSLKAQINQARRARLEREARER